MSAARSRRRRRERLALTAGPLPAPGTLPEPYPYESIAPAREGFVERDGVRSLVRAVRRDRAVARVRAGASRSPTRTCCSGVVPWLAQHFRVVVGDLRGNGRSDRPTSPEQYTFDHYHADFVAVLDRLEVDRAALVGISAATMTVLRVAAEQPGARLAPGDRRRLRLAPARRREAAREDGKKVVGRMRADWPAYLDEFFGIVFSEPHSTKPYEDGVPAPGQRQRRPDRLDGPGGLVRRRPARTREAGALRRRS